jgi:hypothetical protein
MRVSSCNMTSSKDPQRVQQAAASLAELARTCAQWPADADAGTAITHHLSCAERLARGSAGSATACTQQWKQQQQQQQHQDLMSHLGILLMFA